MRRGLFIPFFLLVTVPLVVLGWLGARAMKDEQALLERRFRDITQARLVDLRSQIQGTVEGLERELLAATEDLDTLDRRSLIRKKSLVRQVFVVGPQGKLAQPKEDGVLSAEEKSFLERTRRIWSGGAILNFKPEAEGKKASVKKASSQPVQQKVQAPSLSKRTATSDSFAKLARRSDHGWVSWYWEEGLHLLFWRRVANGSVVGVEVERIALLGRVVGRLPTDHSLLGRVVLADSKGEPVYQWGGQDHALAKKALVSLHLQHPLDAWQLRYMPHPSELVAGPLPIFKWNMLLALSLLALVLLGLASFFYRESSREMRLAARRVNFVTQVSHELKTPLTNLRLYGELLQENLPEDDPKLDKYAGVIIEESERLSRLIGNVLTFSRRKNELLQIRKKPTCMGDLLEPALARFQPAFDRKNIQVEVEDSCTESFDADTDAVGQILENLLSNVEKYAGAKSQVKITCTQNPQSVVLQIQDDGPGIADSQREKVFDPFYRISHKLTDGVTGTGIGLSIARHLARLHGGDLRMVSSSQGACFELTLPRIASGDMA